MKHTMTNGFYAIRSRPICNPDWGDYGDILQNGMSMHLPRQNGSIALERTGPFVPPITAPINIILTSAARTVLESSGLRGFDFIPVVKAHIVELHWERWNLSADTPAEYPESGEPEDYILARPHSPALADTIGDLWELVSNVKINIVRPDVVNQFTDLRVDASSWTGDDVLRSDGYGSLIFSERAHQWLSEKWDSYLCFEQFGFT